MSSKKYKIKFLDITSGHFQHEEGASHSESVNFGKTVRTVTVPTVVISRQTDEKRMDFSSVNKRLAGQSTSKDAHTTSSAS